LGAALQDAAQPPPRGQVAAAPAQAGAKTPAGRESDGETGAGREVRTAPLHSAARRRPREMKESILDVLLYLVEHYVTEDVPPPLGDRDANGPLLNELTQAGFSLAEVHKALDWLDALAAQRPGASPARPDGPIRVYFGNELDKLDTECRGFLLFLEQQGVLDAGQRELVLDRAMALDQDELDLDDLKWVVLMVLFNQPGAEAAYAWMETQMFLDEPEPVH
jgi:Smg protein